MENRLIHSYPEMIEAALLNLADINEQLSNVRESLKDAEIEALGAATDARGEDQKPLYTNDRARERAAHQTLKADDSYQRDKATERILERRKVTMEAQAERLRREYRIALLDYESQLLGHRAA
jgi:hypothetical protein